MKQLYEVRKEYGGIYVTAFPDGLLIPWKPLVIGDYVRYLRDYNRGLIPPSCLEDEIFRSCVIDHTIIQTMDFMKAGIITTVVQNIWQFSGPNRVDELKNDLNSARILLQSDGTKALHDLVRIITMAFPYKPEEIYSMEYETFLLRAAQAESKLLEMGLIKTAIVFDGLEEIENSMPKQNKLQIDAKQLWEQQEQRKQAAIDSTIVQQKKQPHTISRKKWWKKSPVLEAKKLPQINFQADANQANSYSLDSHDLNEPPEMQEYLMEMKTRDSRDKMIRDARVHYKDLLEELGKKQIKK